MKDKIKVILVDDHDVVRASFRMLLSTVADIDVIAEADRGEVAWELYLEQQPDIMLLDLSMPGIGGLAASAITTVTPRYWYLAFTMKWFMSIEP